MGGLEHTPRVDEDGWKAWTWAFEAGGVQMGFGAMVSLATADTTAVSCPGPSDWRDHMPVLCLLDCLTHPLFAGARNG